MENIEWLITITSSSITIPLMVIVICLIFKKPISMILEKIIEFRARYKGLDIFLELEKKEDKLPHSGDTIFSDEDIINELNKIEELEMENIKSSLTKLKNILLKFGITTKPQLIKLINSKNLLDILRKLYRNELKRNIDSVGFVTYGSILYLYGAEKSIINTIKNDIRKSPEYKTLISN